MTRKNYDEYEYLDTDLIYIYPDGQTLINKQGIKDSLDADQNEHFHVNRRLIELVLEPISVNGMEDVRKIHAHLFGDIYEWAGHYRRVNISKEGKPFMAMQSFGTGEEYLNSLLTSFLNTANEKADVIFHLARILDNLNYMHPFREGNGRCQREVIRVLALSKGYQLDIKVSADENIYHLYMDGTVHSRIDLLEQLIDQLLIKL